MGGATRPPWNGYGRQTARAFAAVCTFAVPTGFSEKAFREPAAIASYGHA
jgi:hypothetical protein